MTAYILTPEQHAQIVDALWVVVEHNRLHHGESSNTVVQCTSALAMLKAMKPASPCAWQRKDDDLITAKEKRPDYAYTHYYDKPLYAKEQQ